MTRPPANCQNMTYPNGCRRIRRLLLALLFGFVLLQSHSLAQVKETRRVLIFNELGLWSPGINAVDQEIFATLEKSPYKIEFYSEELDTSLFPEEALQRQFRESYFVKYRERKPDLIIAIGPSALKFMIESHKAFAPGTPIVFWGNTGEFTEPLRLDPDFTGVWGVAQPGKTLDAALHLLPDTKHVVVTGGVAPYDRQLEALVRKSFHSYEAKLDFTYLTDLPMPALLERLKHLPQNTIVYHTSIMQDSAGTPFIDATQSAPLVAAAANAPVFAVDDVDIGRGTVGGDVFSFALTGQVVAGMAVRILNGEKPQGIPVVKGANAYVFDWRALKRWGLKERDLPPGSIVLNRQPTFWETYKQYIATGTLILLAQTLVIVALLWQRAKRRRGEEELWQSNERLQLAMAAGKSVGWEWSLKSGRDFFFGDLPTMFGIPSETFTGKVDDFYRYVHPEDLQRVSQAVSDAQKSRFPYAQEFRIVRSDGVIRWISSRGKFDYRADGKATRMIGMAVDITDRKKTEQALKKSEEKFSTAFRESPMAFTLTSAKDHRYLEVNETFEHLSGWARQEVIGRTPFDIGLWVDPSQREELSRQMSAGSSVRNFEVSFRTKSGAVRTGLGSADLIEIDGEPCVVSLIADITEHKQVQERLRESQNRLESLVASAMDAIIAVDEDQRIVVFNNAAEKMFACPASEAIGTPVSRFIPARFRVALGEAIRHFGEADVSNRATDAFWAMRANGEEFPIDATISHTETGGKKLSTVILRDVTDRKKAEETRFRYASIVESSDDAIISKDLEGVILTWNRGAQRLFGFTEAEAVGQPISIIVPEELQEEHKEFMRRARNSEHIEHFETVRRTKDGKRLHVSLTVSPLQDWTGKTIGTSKIARDITQRKQAESALRESEERFRLVANTAPVMIWMSGPDRLCIYFNQPWLAFTGRSIHAELGNGWTEGVYPEDLDRCVEMYKDAFDLREPFKMEFRLRRHDGEYRWILNLGVPRWDADHFFAGYIGSCLDVTERIQAEEALSSVSRRLIEAHEEERTWIARELHDDVNQRVAMAAMNLERLKQQLPPSADLLSQGLSELRSDLSDLGMDIQTISHRLHSSKLEYLGIVAAASSFCREFSEKKGVEIDFRSEGVPKNLSPEIGLCLFRVLQEAVGNAVKYSRSDHLEVALEEVAHSIQLQVCDFGIGFDPEEVAAGRGLGLISMKERLKLVNGSLYIDTGPNRGVLIRATVPVSGSAISAHA